MHLHFTPQQLKTAASIWQRGLKSSARLVGLLVRAIPLIVGANSLSWVKAAFVFSRFVTSFIKCQGQRGLAIYLKAANVSMMRSLAGKRIENPRLAGAAVALSNTGLPRIIPGNHRLRMIQGDVGVIRLWLGFFTLYRVLEFRGKLSLRTITDPGVYLGLSTLIPFTEFSKKFADLVVGLGGKRYRTDLVPSSNHPRFEYVPEEFIRAVGNTPYGGKTAPLYTQKYWRQIWGYGSRFFPLMKSGPNSFYGAVSVGMFIHDAAAWFSRPKLFEAFMTLVALTRSWGLVDNPGFWAGRMMLFKQRNVPGFFYEGPLVTEPKSKGPEVEPGQPFLQLGRLHTIEEPGKIRVVAMVDCWTQWLLAPLHRFIFDKLLRVIPQDGTFDQLKPVKKLIGKMREKGLLATFSFDLSAATDRIPVRLQQEILGKFVTDEFAFHWRALLCDRYYATPPIVRRTFGWALSKVRYAVGQPMGAYSSWAMLALVHHAIVQWAAARIGRSGWFDLYAVLGDDIVIGDRAVADEYVFIMEEIGVKIGFSKSIISNNLSLEFAKRFFYKGVEVTPLPLIGIAVGWLGVSGVPEIMKIIEAKTGKLPTLSLLAKALGFGFKACSSAATSRLSDLPRMLRSIVILLSRPGQPLGVDNLWEWVRLKRYKSVAPATARWYDAVIVVARQRLLERKLGPVRKSVYKAFLRFEPDSTIRQGVVQLLSWWTETIVKPYKDPMYDLIQEVEDKQTEIRDGVTEHDDASLIELLSRLDELESALCRLPTSVDLFRNSLMVMGKDRKKSPKNVRLWNKLTKFVRRGH